MVTITKKKLLEVACLPEHKKKVKRHWPKFRQKISLTEFIQRARRARASEHDIQITLWMLDHPGWEKVRHKSKLPSSDEGWEKEIVDIYIKLFGGADDD